MKKLISCFLFLFLANSSYSGAAESKKTFSKKDITNLADAYINNNVGVKNPVIIDIDNDSDFDILDFTKNGKVAYYKNTGSLTEPFFVLENKNFDNYEMNSFIPNGIPIPVFLADKDGDGDADIFGITKEDSKYKAAYAENAFDFDHYTLITIILVLLIIVLLIAIL
ncbi:MAG: hypothetical protein WBQ38_01175 [Ignavibacteria bacterium]|nr:hypothetical protein [Ignavibacteria bacterium]